MKKYIVISAVLLAALQSCTKKEAEKPVDASKTLVYCSESSPSGFSPQITEDGTSINAQNPVYNRLVTIERGKTVVVPDLAESWDISKDQKHYTFHLRKDVKFHTTPTFKPTRNMNADDVLFSYNRQRLADHPFHKVSGGNYVYFVAMGMDIMQDIKKIDDYTVEVVLSRPEAPFLANLTMEFMSIFSKEYADQEMKKGTPENIDTTPVGTGPFIFRSYVKDSIIRYDANPDYYGARKAMVDKMVFEITPDANVRSQKIRAGECHLIGEPPIVDRKIFAGDANLKMEYLTGLNLNYLAFNTEKKPFDNLLVRKAIAHALNRGAYVEAIFGGLGEVAESALPSTNWGYNSNLPTYDYNIEKAKELLKQAGYPNGFETDLWAIPVTRPYSPDGRKMAEMMQADLAAVGIKVKIVTYDWPTYLSKTKAGDHTMIQFGWTSDNGDPDNFLYTQLSCDAVKAGANRARWCNKAFNDLLEKAKHTSNIDERTELYMDAQKIFKEQLPWVPVASSKTFRVMRKNVSGFIMDPLGHDYFDGVAY